MTPHSGKDWVEIAKDHGLVVKMGKGDHVKVYGPAGRGYEVIPLHKELGKNLDCKIAKWFKACGILVALVLGILLWMGVI